MLHRLNKEKVKVSCLDDIYIVNIDVIIQYCIWLGDERIYEYIKRDIRKELETYSEFIVSDNFIKFRHEYTTKKRKIK